MSFIGTFKSSIPDVCGTIIADLEGGDFTLNYTGKFKTGESKIIRSYKSTKGKWAEGPFTGTRWIFIPTEATLEQLFLFTFIEYDTGRVSGFYSCILPHDKGTIEMKLKEEEEEEVAANPFKIPAWILAAEQVYNNSGGFGT